jgi:DNA-directed RNA polymerase subunit F
LQIQTPSCYKEEALQIAHKSKRETMTHSEAMEILGHLAVKLEMQMRFQEREAIEYAISKLTTVKKDDPNALAQMILDAAKQASDLHAKGLI